jgi:uncharacterized protein
MTLEPSELDAFFSPRSSGTWAVAEARRLGMVVGGSLSEGLTIKLDRGAVVEGMAVGRYVVIRGQTGRRFFGIVSDVALDSANPAMEKTPPDTSDPFVAQVLQGTSTFGRLQVTPLLVLDEGASEPRPVKTVPAHFAAAYEASEEDVNQVFGTADAQHFYVGTPLDMEQVHVHLDLKRFVERSSGVFGKSGTGKTFLTRMLLAGVIKQDVASTLVFDMHNEYGWETEGEAGHYVKGLRQLFPGQVSVMTLDKESSDRRGSKTDFTVQIGYDQIEPEDVEMLSTLMGLSDVQVGALYHLYRRLGRSWIQRLLADRAPREEGEPDELEEMVSGDQITSGTLGAIQRKLGMFRRFSFLKPQVPEDAVGRIVNYVKAKKHVVLEFGRYGNTLEAYILVANFLTRRIHASYVIRKEEALGDKTKDPRALVIVIEEAHKFLDPVIAGHTIFGTIARELRKYNVTLLIVDQRPSGIDEEVMSQIGTRVTALLDNEADIRAVFMGVSGATELRQVLARLDTRQQALIMGHAVPMPVVVQTRTYGPELYTAVGYSEGSDLQDRLERNTDLLRGEESEGLD